MSDEKKEPEKEKPEAPEKIDISTPRPTNEVSINSSNDSNSVRMNRRGKKDE